jgi:8-oxo-dGTP pyrophosphatase MutT (NUDIX family)
MEYNFKKVSAGIICINYYDGEYRVLVVKKKISYAFEHFIRTIHKKKKTNELIKCFKAMTFEEKFALSTFNIEYILYKLYSDFNPSKKSKSTVIYNFTKYFTAYYSYNLIYNLLNTTSSTPLEYDLPRGRVDADECYLETAMREFREETTLTKKQYRLFPRFKCMHSIIDNNITYEYNYFLALLEDTNNKINRNNINYINFYNKKQSEELNELRWLTLNELKFYNYNIYKLVKKGVNYINKRIR